MRRQHFAVLSSLAEQGAASQAAIGRRLWIDRSDLHAILADLERDGLVARVRDEQDRRRNVVTLTPAGTAALKRLDKRVEAAQDVVARRIEMPACAPTEIPVLQLVPAIEGDQGGASELLQRDSGSEPSRHELGARPRAVARFDNTSQRSWSSARCVTPS
jgi:DNA-binding MarR family transcriptional regulator